VKILSGGNSRRVIRGHVKQGQKEMHKIHKKLGKNQGYAAQDSFGHRRYGRMRGGANRMMVN